MTYASNPFAPFNHYLKRKNKRQKTFCNQSWGSKLIQLLSFFFFLFLSCSHYQSTQCNSFWPTPAFTIPASLIYYPSVAPTPGIGQLESLVSHWICLDFFFFFYTALRQCYGQKYCGGKPRRKGRRRKVEESICFYMKI